MALRIGQGGLILDVPAESWLQAFTGFVDMNTDRIDGLRMRLSGLFPSAMNNQLRTGADKGNPTV